MKPALSLLATLLCCGVASSTQAFTNIAAIRALSPAIAQTALEVHVRGQVTYVDGRDYNGLFLQDSSAGIYVELPAASAKPGDLINLSAVTGRGHFAPVLVARKIELLGTIPLPAARESTFEEIYSGALDSLRVEVSGIVRSVAPATHNRIYLDLMMGNDRLRTLVSDATVEQAEAMIAATVKVSGVSFARFNRKRQLLACWLGVNNLHSVRIIQNAPPINDLLISALYQYQTNHLGSGRVRLRGTVTHQQPGKWIFIRDDSQGLLVKTQQGEPLQPGDIVELLGFPALGQYEPILEDGVFRKVGHGALPAPIKVSADQLLSGEFDADLIAFEARVVDRMGRGDEQTLVLAAGNLLFNAQLETKNADELLRRAPNGGKVGVTGICLVQPLEHWRPRQNARAESFRVVIRSPEDILLLQRPSFITLPRVLWTLAVVSIIALLSVVWAVALRRRVRTQTEIIGEKVKREAILEERSRLARELHDTLEQELVGITMQLDAAAARLQEEPPVARQFLDMARTISRRTFSEVRRSVWDLRSHFLESGDLAAALKEIIKPLKNGSPVEVSVIVHGEARRLPARLENNLLRIGQEAVSNALKHSSATSITVELRYEPNRLRLTVRDNGSGFQPRPHASPGHFGLLDMRERAEKIGGDLLLDSAGANGTTISVQVPTSHEVGI